jgi:hypothetical protein
MGAMVLRPSNGCKGTYQLDSEFFQSHLCPRLPRAGVCFSVGDDNAPALEQIRAISEDLEKENTARERMVSAFAYGSIDENELHERTDDIKAKISLLEEQKAMLENSLQPQPDFDPESFKEDWWEQFAELRAQLRAGKMLPIETSDTFWIQAIDKDLPEGEPTLEYSELPEALLALYKQLNVQVTISGPEDVNLVCALTDKNGISLVLTVA